MDYQPSLISIIVPIFNTTNEQLIYTKICLNSIVGNATMPYELILVDDGSDKATKDYLDSVCTELGKFGINHILMSANKNIGLPHALNKGFAMAKGEYICEIDTDVAIPRYWMDTLATYLAGHPKTGVVSGIDYYSVEQIHHDVRFWLSKAREKVERLEKHLNHDPLSWAWFFNICYGDFGEYVRNMRTLLNSPTPYVKSAHWMVHRKVLEALKTTKPFDEKYDKGGREDSDLVLNIERNTPYKCEAISATFCHHFGNKTYEIMDRKSIYEKNDKYFYEKWGIEHPIPKEEWR